ncbi:hypothetical protein BC940DRAFT_293793 [Gongronella butleri]|nr:hypothetical protein BC940DRAFT_293793 [Gongronella butleri]
MGLLSTSDRLSFGSLKPVILRGAPDVDASSVLDSELRLTLSKTEKITSIAVCLKSTSKSFWPEGLGQRAKQVTHDEVLHTQTLTLIEEKTMLDAGEHHWPFTFIIPNSTIDTIETQFGRVKHTIEATVTRGGKTLLQPEWKLAKPILILRSYMSDALLVSNSIRDLSHTFERHLTAGDVSVMVEYTAFSSGDLYNVQFVIQPQQKECRLENIKVAVTETRQYRVDELGAWRKETKTYPLSYAYATPLGDADSLCHAYIEEDDMLRVFEKGAGGLPLVDTFAYRVAFATPTCQENFHHSTHYRAIHIRHHLHIDVTLSHVDLALAAASDTPPLSSTPSSPPSGSLSPPLNQPNHAQQQQPSWPSVVARLRKGKKHLDKHRVSEKVQLEMPMIVFDCRLKEDYSHLPSYFETGLVEAPFTTIMPAGNTHGAIDQQRRRRRHHAYLCPCYHEFRRQMEQANAALAATVPTIPPPDYVEKPDPK